RLVVATIAAALLVAATAIALLASGGGADARVPPTKDATYLNADSPGVLSFENGDCFHDVDVNEAMGEPALNTIGCIGAENQVYGFARLPDGPWDAGRVARDAERGCRELAAEVWTVEQRRALRFFPAPPSRRSWTADEDRDAMCVVYSPAGPFRSDPVTTGRAT
ncbi:hypothetical protein ACVU7I_15030, partial [Patulibacter sp. S7RM1-6]